MTEFGLKSSSIFIILAVVFVSGVLYNSDHHAFAQVSPDEKFNKTTITVQGSATANLGADKVMLSLGVNTKNDTASEALDENNAITQRVINALEAAGVTSDEIQTAYFNISPVYQSSPNSYGPGNLTGYSVSNTITVTSTNLGGVSSWIDAAVKAGANVVNNVSFTVSDDKIKSNVGPLVSQAINDAKSRADEAASNVGLKVVGLKSMNLYYNGGGYYYGGAVLSSGGGAGSPVPIIPGEQQVNVQVSAVYILG